MGRGFLSVKPHCGAQQAAVQKPTTVCLLMSHLNALHIVRNRGRVFTAGITGAALSL